MRKNLLILSMLGALAAPAPAVANSSSAVSDCNSNGYLSHHYSRSDLQGALQGMGADVKEYTNCYDVIRRALDATAAGGSIRGGGGSGGAGGSGGIGGASAIPGVSTRGVYGPRGGIAPASPGSGAPVALGDGGPALAPGGSAVNAAATGNTLPAPLIVVLVLLALAALLAGVIAVRRRSLPSNSRPTQGFRRVLHRSGG